MFHGACSQISALALATLLLCAKAAVAVPAAAHAYSFSPPLNYNDELGGPPIKPLWGGKLVAGGYFRFQEKQGLGLPPIVLASPAVYSIEMRLKIDDVSGYRKLVDCQGLVEPGLYINSGSMHLWPAVKALQPSITALKWAHVLLTRNSAGLVTVYVNGVKQVSYNDAVDKYFVFAVGAVRKPVYLLRDNLAENASGFLAYVRLYNSALGPADAAALSRGVLPPNVKTA